MVVSGFLTNAMATRVYRKLKLELLHDSPPTTANSGTVQFRGKRGGNGTQSTVPTTVTSIQVSTSQFSSAVVRLDRAMDEGYGDGGSESKVPDTPAESLDEKEKVDNLAVARTRSGDLEFNAGVGRGPRKNDSAV